MIFLIRNNRHRLIEQDNIQGDREIDSQTQVPNTTVPKDDKSSSKNGSKNSSIPRCRHFSIVEYCRNA